MRNGALRASVGRIVACGACLAALAHSGSTGALDLLDPLPPTNVVATSDYSTPTSVLLTWTDPSTLVDGSPLLDFSIDVIRDGVLLANVEQGVQLLLDGSLQDGRQYEYTLRARDDENDRVSVVVDIFVFAGGSPFPGAPLAPSCNADSASITVDWTNPATQADGTLLDDFAGLRLYRNGALLVEMARAATDTASTDSYVDQAVLPGISYSYAIAAFDSEVPSHESALQPVGTCTSNTVPPILLWKPSDILSSSPETMQSVFSALGERTWLTNDLFTFGPNLSGHEIVYVFAGIYPNNHLISDPEGLALDAFVFAGGRLLLEGGDCLNYDPEVFNTYDLRAVFGLLDGPDGTRDLFQVAGLNDLAGFTLQYVGPNRFTDDLVPLTSIPILRNAANTDVASVFYPHYGVGRSMAFTFEFGHLVDLPSASPSNTKANLLAECLHLLRDTNPPTLVTSLAEISDSLFAGDSTTAGFTISNPGSINADLAFTIEETPPADWISCAPGAGSLAGNEVVPILVTLDARLLGAGAYATNLVVAANDSANAADTVAVSLVVTPPPDLVVSPDSLSFVVETLGGVDVDSLTISNAGDANLTYSLEIDPGGSERVEFPSVAASFFGGNRYRGNVYRVDEATSLRRIDHLLTLVAPTSVEFFVYESPDSGGVYTKIFSRTTMPAAGSGWQTSGPIQFTLPGGKFYFVGAGWQGSLTYYSDSGGTSLPAPVPFGACLGSAGSNVYPPPPTRVLAPAPSINSQAIEFGETADVVLLSPTSGSLLPSESATVVLRATGHDIPGIYPAALDILSNDPFLFVQTVRSIPIRVLVGPPTDAPLVTPLLRPTRVELHQSAPNPFRSSTTIRFGLPRNARATLTVYDLAGRRVRTLHDDETSAGFFEVTWDGRDASGRTVSSGVYFYALETSDEAIRRKFVRLR